MRRSFANFLVCVCALAASASCKKSAESSGAAANNAANGPIVIGEVGSMTGPTATFGVSSDHGIQLALKDINTAGGVKGRQLQVIVLDDQGKPEEAATATTRLIFSNHVVAILGEVASSLSLNMADKAQSAKVPMVSPSSTNPKVTQQGDYIFRACFVDTFQGYVMAKFAREYLKAKKVAILRDVRQDYSVGLAETFTQNFTKMGGEISASESFSSGDVDFKAQLTNIKATNPDAVFVPGYYNEAGLIAGQMKQAGITAPMIGGDGWDSERLYEIGGANIEGSYFSNHYSVDDPTPRIQEFVAKYKKEFAGQLPDSLSAQAYDATLMLADAMKRAKDLTGATIRDALAQTKNFEGVTGTITMDENRNPVKPAAVLKVGKGGKYEFAAKIWPEGMTPPADQAKGPGATPTPATQAPATTSAGKQ